MALWASEQKMGIEWVIGWLDTSLTRRAPDKKTTDILNTNCAKVDAHICLYLTA